MLRIRNVCYNYSVIKLPSKYLEDTDGQDNTIAKIKRTKYQPDFLVRYIFAIFMEKKCKINHFEIAL